jgi:hypothetical protein
MIKEPSKTSDEPPARPPGPEAKRQVVDQVTRELSVHAAIEEAYFYPEVKKAPGRGWRTGG